MNNIIFQDEPILLRLLRRLKFFYVKTGFNKSFIESNYDDIRKGNDIIRELITNNLSSPNELYGSGGGDVL